MPAVAFKIGEEAIKTDSPLNAFFSKEILHITGSRFCHVEYWLDGELVHRSVHVHLKKALVMGAEAAKIA